jgi:hypothetical protein
MYQKTANQGISRNKRLPEKITLWIKLKRREYFETVTDLQIGLKGNTYLISRYSRTGTIQIVIINDLIPELSGQMLI